MLHRGVTEKLVRGPRSEPPVQRGRRGWAAAAQPRVHTATQRPRGDVHREAMLQGSRAP